MNSVAIVGGGPAGAHAASLLAARGLKPVVFERAAGPADKICGEFLSAEAQGELARSGFDCGRLGGEVVDRVRLAAGRRLVEAKLPFQALGISRRRLDEALLAHAEGLGATVARGLGVRSVAPGRVSTDAGEERAAAIVLASGKHDVRGARRLAPVGAGRLVGFKTYFTLEPVQRAALAGAVELVFFEGGYAGLQRVEDGRANLCLIMRREAFDKAGRTWAGLRARLMEAPHLARRLGGAREDLERPLAIADPPFGFRHLPSDDDFVYRAGDQAAVIEPFTGDGMAMALIGASLAAEAVAAGAPPARHHARLRRAMARPVTLAAWLARRLDAWPGADAAVALASLWPPLVGRFAAWTRAPASASPPSA